MYYIFVVFFFKSSVAVSSVLIIWYFKRTEHLFLPWECSFLNLQSFLITMLCGSYNTFILLKLWQRNEWWFVMLKSNSVEQKTLLFLTFCQFFYAITKNKENYFLYYCANVKQNANNFYWEVWLVLMLLNQYCTEIGNLNSP